MRLFYAASGEELNPKVIKGEIGTIEKKTHQFLNRIVEADSTPLITAYENQVRTLEEQRIALKEKVSNCGRPLQPFDQTFRTAMEFLGNPQKLWASERMEDKKAVLKLAFTDKLPYDKNTGFRTPEKSMPLSLLEGLSTPQSRMVRLDRASSNQLFEILADWNTVLQGLNSDVLSEVPEPEI